MTFRIFIFLCLFGLPTWCLSQKTYWASKVEAVSSEYVDSQTNGQQYRASQVLGPPNKLPQVGKSPCAWMPLVADNAEDDFIIVAFDTVMAIRQVAIAENFGQGCITKIIAFDEYNNQQLILENQVKPSRSVGRMFTFFLPQMSRYKVRAIKLILNTKRVPRENQIDAIGISQSETPIQANINVIRQLPDKYDQYQRENLGVTVNSAGDEICPVISPDGKQLYFTREPRESTANRPIQNVWVSDIQTDKNWSQAKLLGPPINNRFANAICALSTDGKRALLNNVYLPNGATAKGTSISSKIDNEWRFPQEVKILNYINLSETSEYTFSSDEKTIIMSSRSNQTVGGKDLYVSFRNELGTWTEPRNLGTTVNSADDEAAPFLAADGRSLYFSTRGRAGYGSNDIFVSRRLDSTWTRWSEPENLGPNINSLHWDSYFTIPANGEIAYFSSVQDSTRGIDIFRIKIPDEAKPESVLLVTGILQDIHTQKNIEGELIFKALGSKDSLSKNYDPKQGDWKVILDTEKKYRVRVQAEGYLAMLEEWDFSQEKKHKELRKVLTLIPLKVGEKLVLKNIQFKQSQVEPITFSPLESLLKTLLENPQMEILLEGHTDNQGDFQLNIELSEGRVKAIKQYLIKHGVAEKRITTRGWGGTQPIASNTTENTRAANRRVEVKITKI
jgi:outer membrane protein OmpA-like peptidoglycan-associated protein